MTLRWKPAVTLLTTVSSGMRLYVVHYTGRPTNVINAYGEVGTATGIFELVSRYEWSALDAGRFAQYRRATGAQ